MLRRARLPSSHILPNFNRVYSSTAKMCVKMTMCEGLTHEELKTFRPYNEWRKRLDDSLKLQHEPPSSDAAPHEFSESPYSLKAIHVQAFDRFGKNLGFVKLTADIANSEGMTLPGAVFLRGASVGMMIVLQPDDVPVGSQQDKHVLLTVQARVAAGSLRFVELPAGMVDNGTFTGSAAKEIKEEIGLDIPEDELINISELAFGKKDLDHGGEDIPKAMFPSAGGCDEFIPIFLHEKQIPRAQLKEWSGKLTGLRDQGEKITLKLVKLEDLWWEGARDAKALAAWALWEGLRREGNFGAPL